MESAESVFFENDIPAKTRMFVMQPFLYVCYALDICGAKSYVLLLSISLLRSVSQNPNKTNFLLYCFPRKEPINIQIIFILFLLLFFIVQLFIWSFQFYVVNMKKRPTVSIKPHTACAHAP